MLCSWRLRRTVQKLKIANARILLPSCELCKTFDSLLYVRHDARDLPITRPSNHATLTDTRKESNVDFIDFTTRVSSSGHLYTHDRYFNDRYTHKNVKHDPQRASFFRL